MKHLVLEIALWTLAAFFAGCAIGYVARRIFASGERAARAQTPVEEAKKPAVVEEEKS
ncbi:hypothetical protein BH10PSE7_BH10PSE7_00590 [soil metagenome]